jgi:hypothetical protein
LLLPRRRNTPPAAARSGRQGSSPPRIELPIRAGEWRRWSAGAPRGWRRRRRGAALPRW